MRQYRLALWRKEFVRNVADAMPAKKTAMIVKPIFAPFCGGELLTPHSCLSKSSQSRLVILESPLVRR